MVGNISISNVLARIISASFNYVFNKRVVFNSKDRVMKTLGEYIILAVFILFLNTIILNLLVRFGANKYIAKIVVELVLFYFSWTVQKRKIFKK